MEKADQSMLAERRARLAALRGLDRLRLINSICRDLVFSDLEETAALLDEAEILVRDLLESRDESERMVRGEAGEVRRLRGVLSFYRARYAEAVQHLEAAREAFAQSDHLEGPGNCWNNLAMVYRYLDDYSRALSFYQKALARAREVRDEVAEANTLGNIGILYFAMGEMEEAGHYIQAAHRRAVDSGKEGLEMTWASNLAELHLARKNTQPVRPLLDRARELSERRGDVSLRIDILRNFGTLHAQKGDFVAASAAFVEARDLAERYSDRRMVVELLVTLGKLLMSLPTHDRESIGLAPEKVLSDALRASERIGVNSLRSEAHRVMAACLEQEERFSEAYAHLKQHAELAVTERNEETSRKLRQQRLLFEVDQTQRELAASRRANEDLQREVERRMTVEEDLRNALEMARHADEVKTRFLATMSHEIRTPMNGVLGMTDVLARTPLNAEQKEAVQVIFEAGHNLLELINDILDLTKLEAGRIQLNLEDFSLAEVVEAVADWAGGRAEEKDLRFEVEFPPELHRAFRGDAARLQQVIRNLLSNAIKFTVEGEISLRFESSESAGWLRVVVEDTGIGIPEERFETVFELFTQLDSSTTRQFGGAGLGLAIARKLTMLMGGVLSVQSTVGVGSRFTLEIPLEERDVTELPVADVSSDWERALRVLVVEDTELNWRVASLLLRRLNAEAVWAPDGYQALEMAASQSFDLVLMDIQMPGIDGAETARRIRENAMDGHQPRIVALTAHPVDDVGEADLLVDIDSVLLKPIDMERLRDALLSTPQRNG